VVDREVGKAKMVGVEGVMNITINGKSQVGGAQDHNYIMEFVRVLERGCSQVQVRKRVRTQAFLFLPNWMEEESYALAYVFNRSAVYYRFS